MGFFDWLFGRKKSETSAPPAPAEPGEEAEEDTGEAEQTTFVSVRLSPKAQAEMKRLRELKDRGAARYQWAITQYACFECKKHAAEGPYDITAGLMRAAPVPGRDTKCDCDTTVEAVDG